MNQKEILEYIQEIRDDLHHVKDYSDGTDFINFKLDILTDMIKEY